MTEGPRVYLHRVYLNGGGYDRNGSYWGRGAPLYHWEPVNPSSLHWGGHVRARDRNHAMAQVRAIVPNARFYTCAS